MVSNELEIFFKPTTSSVDALCRNLYGLMFLKIVDRIVSCCYFIPYGCCYENVDFAFKMGF